MKIKCHQCQNIYSDRERECPFCRFADQFPRGETLAEEGPSEALAFHSLALWVCEICKIFHVTLPLDIEDTSATFLCSQGCEKPLRLPQEPKDLKGIRYLGPLPRASIQEKTSNSSDTTIRRRFGKYRLEKKLGKGGMGVVYRAYDPDLQRTLALKLVLSQVEDDLEYLARFQKEVQMAAKLHHPYIVPIFEGGSVDDTPFYTMGYIAGTNLKDYVEKYGPLDQTQALEIIQALAQAVSYAHSMEVIHRDIKPENVMLDKEMRPYLLDFGLARDLKSQETSITRTGLIIGTPAFMSPEQARGDKAGLTSDIYALGGVLFYMVTGRPPFVDDDFLNLIKQVAEKEAPRLRKINSDISWELEVMTGKCLEKNPRQRYIQAAMLQLDAQAVLQGEPIMAQPPGFVDTTMRWMRQNLILSAPSVVLVMVALLGMLGWRIVYRFQQDWKITALVEKADKILEEVPTAKKLRGQFQREEYDFRPPSMVEREEWERAQEAYGEVLEHLEEAVNVSNKSNRVRIKIFQAEKEIGLLALLHGDFTTAKRSFNRCLQLTEKYLEEKKKYHDEAKSLLGKWEKAKEKHQTFLVGYVNSIADEAKKAKSRMEVAPLVRRLGKLWCREVARQVVELLENRQLGVRLMALEALGSWGDSHTVISGKKLHQWLKGRKEIEIPLTGEEKKSFDMAMEHLSPQPVKRDP